MNTADYIVIGSGCSGAMAAQTLVEAGANVMMIDVGVAPNKLASEIPSKDYLTIRKTEPSQSRYFVGTDGEGISWGKLSKGAQVTPPRQHIAKFVDDFIPMESSSFTPLESLAYGGLGVGWGLQCWEFSSADMKATGLSTSKMSTAYEVVSRRIGISATRDSAAPYTLGDLESFMPSAMMDRNHLYIKQLYDKKKARLLREGLYVGRTPLALITEDKDDRKAYDYRGMDFYSDEGRSAWRPNVTIDKLREYPNFIYHNELLALRFNEDESSVTIACLNVKSKEKTDFKAKKLIIACGSLGSARLVLRSLGDGSSTTSLLSNPHTYIPCIQPVMFGKGSEAHKLGLGQLSYFIDKKGDDSGLSVASSYSYQSLMSFRLVPQMPFNFSDARSVAQYIMPGIVILIAQHPDSLSKQKLLRLVPDESSITGDKLFASYQTTAQDDELRDVREKQYVRALRSLHTFALKRVDPGHGSGIHYAGTLPFNNKAEQFSLSPDGRLHGKRRTFVADSSGFKYLPAKGLTFSLMANAHLTALNALSNDA